MLIKIDEIEKVLKEKHPGAKVVATNGCFDVLHVGHLRYLKESKKLADLLVVGLNSDKSVKALKGESRPVNSELDRAELVAALEPVDYVVIFDEIDACNFLKAVKPSIYSKGGDYQAENLPEYPTALELGTKIVFVDLIPGKSSSNTIDKLANTN